MQAWPPITMPFAAQLHALLGLPTDAAAYLDPDAAKALLGVMTGLQACFALHALVQWPYISQVLNCVEWAAACLKSRSCRSPLRRTATCRAT
jgi:hypothetical protein